MRIQDLKRLSEGNRESVAATVVWEDCARDPQEIHFSTTSEFADGLACNPNAFLLASIIPAMYQGEQRVLVEGAVCPRLRNGLITAMQILRDWYGDEHHKAVTIEATQGFSPGNRNPSGRVASFMSGGVDSLTTLQCNRMDFPLDHPDSIRDCIFIHGFDLGGYEDFDQQYESYEFVLNHMSGMARDAKVALIPVYTNLRFLEDETASPSNNWLFTMESHAAAMGAVAHAFSARLSCGMIPSTNSVSDLSPLGSHPLLDPNYSSSEISIQHDGTRLERIDKLRIISEWGSALEVLRTCQNPPSKVGVLNCGECEKCARTMTELLILGKLSEAVTYPMDDVSPSMLRGLRAPNNVDPDRPYAILSPVTQCHWRNLVLPLRQLGRGDLVDAITEALAEYDKYLMCAEETGWKGFIKGADRKYFGSSLKKLIRSLKSS